MKKLAKFWKRHEGEKVQCTLCPRYCVIPPNKLGFCRARKNENGELYTLVYGSIISMAADPIEKKPLYHFWPGSQVFSIAVPGCNFVCKHCFTPNTYIATDRGILSIEEIFKSDNGLRVITDRGRFRDVTKVFRHDYEGEIIRIKPTYLPALTCTPDHRIFVKDQKGEIKKLRAAEITPKHFLVVPKRVASAGVKELDLKSVLSEFDAQPSKINREITPCLFEELKKKGDGGWTCRRIGTSFSLNSASIRNLFVKVRKGSKGVFEDTSPNLIEDDECVRFKNEKSEGVKNTRVTPALARLLGLYCAGGCVRRHAKKPDAHGLVFSFGPHERKLAEETRGALREVFGVESAARKESTAIKVYVENTPIAVLFKLLCGDKASNKQVPPFLFNTDRSISNAFLEGYFGWDGTFERDCMDAITASKRLALGLCELILTKGTVPSFYEHGPEGKRLEGRIVRKQPYYIIRMPGRFDFGKNSERRNRNYQEDDKNFFVPIEKISIERYSGPVYNLEVKEDHSYTANFIGVGNCQNWTISQVGVEDVDYEDLSPERVVELTKRYRCKGIATTYTEPTLATEFAIDIGKLAHREGLYNVYVTNGYITPSALEELGPHLDAANVDVKAFSDDFYRRICGVPGIRPVLETCEWLVEHDKHLEITYLVIPRENDGTDEIREFCRWVADELGPEVPTHFSRFYPHYRMTDRGPTPVETLERAVRVAKEEGLHYVYIGNVPGHEADNTYCPSCSELLIGRYGFSITRYGLKDKRCPKCGAAINIVGEYTRSERGWWAFAL